MIDCIVRSHYKCSCYFNLKLFYITREPYLVSIPQKRRITSVDKVDIILSTSTNLPGSRPFATMR